MIDIDSSAAVSAITNHNGLGVGELVCGNRYKIISHIADGSVAAVYEARDEQTGQVVALKVLDPLRGADAVGRARFEREFVTVSHLSHPGIARCMRLERDKDLHLDILVLEYIEGETLAARLSRGRIDSVDGAMAIALGLAEALEACHAAGIIHRDLKPANIVLHPKRGPVILDFGMAWFGAAANLTRTGAIVGSPQYMAPELFTTSYVDARADIFAVGAILFEMLAGRPMRLGTTVTELAAQAHAHAANKGSAAEKPTAVSILNPAVSSALDAIVARAAASRPEDRYATAKELIHALRAGTPGAPRGLKARTTCARCKTSLVVDLPFCPGCGKEVAWGLSPGDYAVQLLDVPDVERCAQWLETRHRAGLLLRGGAMRARLRHMPVPIAVGISEETAEQLLVEARDVGCRAEIVRARAIIGTRIRSSAATTREVLAVFGLHFSTVMVVGFWIALLGNLGDDTQWLLFLLPSFVALVLGALAAIYVRRPLLRSDAHPLPSTKEGVLAPLRGIREALASIQTERARALAASAILRAAPALAGPRAESLPFTTRHDVWQSLLDALAASTELDGHAEYLQSRSRARISAEMEQARVRVVLGDQAAGAKLVVLEQEREDLLEAAIAHDLAARRALEDAQSISNALAPYDHPLR